jgi:hemoglobin
MKATRTVILAAAIAACVVSSVRAGDDNKPASLYERLGGMPAIQAVIDDFVGRVMADERVNGWFARFATDPEAAKAYKSKLADFICQATGGPCKYTGADMFSAHKGHGVTAEAFQAEVSDLVVTLEKFKVPEIEKGQLLGLLAQMKPAVVQEQR